MDCSTPSFPVLHSLLEFSQTHFHWVGDTNEPSHSLSKGLSGVFSTITIWKQQFLMLSLFYGKTLTSTHNYWKKHSIDSANSVSQSCLTLGSLWTAERQASLYKTSSQTLLKLMSIKSVMPSNPLILCHPLLLLPSIFHSIRVSSNELVLHIRWPK